MSPKGDPGLRHFHPTLRRVFPFLAGLEPATRGFSGPLLYLLSYQTCEDVRVPVASGPFEPRNTTHLLPFPCRVLDRFAGCRALGPFTPETAPPPLRARLGLGSATPYPSRLASWSGGGQHHLGRHRLRFPRGRPVSRFRPPLASPLPPAELKARRHGGTRLAWVDPGSRGGSAQASSLSRCYHPLSAPGRASNLLGATGYACRVSGLPLLHWPDAQVSRTPRAKRVRHQHSELSKSTGFSKLQNEKNPGSAFWASTGVSVNPREVPGVVQVTSRKFWVEVTSCYSLSRPLGGNWSWAWRIGYFSSTSRAAHGRQTHRHDRIPEGKSRCSVDEWAVCVGKTWFSRLKRDLDRLFDQSPIPDTLARRLEQHLQQPRGWLDEPRIEQGVSTSLPQEMRDLLSVYLRLSEPNKKRLQAMAELLLDE